MGSVFRIQKANVGVPLFSLLAKNSCQGPAQLEKVVVSPGGPQEVPLHSPVL